MLGRNGRSDGPNNQVVGFLSCPAKTYLRPDGQTVLGRSTAEHCQIVGEVAREIIGRYPRGLKESLFPRGSEFAAACHDIGKVSPCFAEKIRQACTVPTPGLPVLTGVRPELERSWGGHAGVSQVTAKSIGAPQWVPEILGQHHGFSPPVSGLRATDDIFGGASWQKEREALIVELKARLSADWPHVASVPQARLLAGLASVSDWIGSGKYFENPDLPWQDSVGAALDDAGFVPPNCQPGLSFEEVFGFPPHDIQQHLVDVVTSPGVYVLEAPMGMGKTEAALYAAYQMLASGQATGVYFALPTQLTSNKIHERFSNFLRRILAEDSQLRPLLLHTDAWLLETEMGEEGRPGGAWFNHAKRGLLAPFAVGTIDQALMAAMNVKHGFVRAFGLAGKVVILDEVHTYDAYTSTLLDALVGLLRSLHCTVIILSATLARDRRRQLVGYESSSDAYPLITAAPLDRPVCELPGTITTSQRVGLRLHQDDGLAIQEVLDRAAQGQQVLWIENTVVEAQQRYLDLAARASELGIACGLLHSRFTPVDRQRIENCWVDLFSKRGWSDRHRQGRILVGTQVLEQSLDIDADFLVSRFAPTDMLLQRLGRLWRHAATPRPTSTRCEAWLLAPELEPAIATPTQAFGSTAHVYSPYVLCRSLEVWQGLTSLNLPVNIRPLIESTYALRDEDGEMARWLYELDNGTPRRTGRKAMHQLARVALAEAGVTLPESKAQTRYSDIESHDVLLLRSMNPLPDQKATLLTLLDGTQELLPWYRSGRDRRQWRQLSAQLMRQVVAIRLQDAPQPVPVERLKKLGFGHCFFLGRDDWKDDESLLRVALVDHAGLLHGLYGTPVHEKKVLEYRDDLGYRVIKQ